MFKVFSDEFLISQHLKAFEPLAFDMVVGTNFPRLKCGFESVSATELEGTLFDIVCVHSLSLHNWGDTVLINADS